jgi:hypothetical protein
MVSEFSFGGEQSLRHFFEDLVWRHFFEDVRLEEADVARYVARLLCDFSRIEQLYRLRTASERQIEDIGEMVIESNPLLEAESFDREREVRKHVGDYALFMAGLFPEKIARRQSRKNPQLEALVDFVEVGKESYSIVSSFDQFEYREEAPLFRRLSDNFELCVMGLNLMRRDFDEFPVEGMS